MHSRGVLHRDIQLGNCVLGLPPNDKVIYMIDFGFSKRYIDPYTKRHIPNSNVKRDFIGNYWFRYAAPIQYSFFCLTLALQFSQCALSWKGCGLTLCES
jgi:serine/threonine protein kinase